MTSRDFYLVERALDPAFTLGIQTVVKTDRPAWILQAGLAAERLYHRVRVFATCLREPLVSNVFSVDVQRECPIPPPVVITATPEKPPPLSTYVVSWAHPAFPWPDLGYRIRRTRDGKSEDSLTPSQSASFSDLPGEIRYDVRIETPCGPAGPWSEQKRVVVPASTTPASLVLVSEPKVMALQNPTEYPATSFVVRNAGSEPLDVGAFSGLSTVKPSPTRFFLPPGQQQQIDVRIELLSTFDVTLHTGVELRAGITFAVAATALTVPISAVFSENRAKAPAVWSEGTAAFNAAGDPIVRSLVNQTDAVAPIVGNAHKPWIQVEAVDGNLWDRPLLPREVRPIRLKVNRARRRVPTGTETGIVSVATVGFGDRPQTLVVMDDGDAFPSGGGDGAGPAGGGRTHVIYPSLPNAIAATGTSRFTSDLWLSNLNAVSPAAVTLVFRPGGTAVRGTQRQRAEAGAPKMVTVTLAPGDIQRLRNVVGNAFAHEGSGSLEIVAASNALSSTALVLSTPLFQGPSPAGASAGGAYGFEMRPVLPGEGVKAADPDFILSGLGFDARQRTNIILNETSGIDTAVEIELLQGVNGDPVLQDGVPVVRRVTVPAHEEVRLNAADIYTGPALSSGDDPRPSVRIRFQPVAGAVASGSVMPMATIVDAITNDSSLRVGVSVRSLGPGGPAIGDPDGGASLPFQGGPMPVLFPVAHLAGAPVDGGTPNWRTRVTFTNTNPSSQRNLTLELLDLEGKPRATPRSPLIFLSARASISFEDLLERAFGFGPTDRVYGAVVVKESRVPSDTWTDVNVETDLYTIDPANPTTGGEYRTGMEGFSYRHGYSSFQSNLGSVQIDGAESSPLYRTNLILQEIGGKPLKVIVSAYVPGSFVPLASAIVDVPALGYVSRELFKGILGLDRTDLTDVRVVCRQSSGDGVYMAFASKINLSTGDPANIFLRPVTAGTGR